MGYALCLLLFALRLGHLRQGNNTEDDEHHKADSDIRVADDSQVMQADICFLGFAESEEQYLSCRVALVRNKLW